MATKTWQCTACGKTTRSNSRPNNKSGGKCPSTASGNHMWEIIEE